MDFYKPYEFFSQEPDLEKRQKMMFFVPFQALIIEGAHEPDDDLAPCVILSSN